jgi:hypothetical protein
MSLVITYLADRRDRVDLCGWSRMECLKGSLATVHLLFPPTPVVIFHKDFLPEDQEALRIIHPETSFEQISFEGHESEHVNMRPDGRTGWYEFCMMNRFFTGVMQQHPAIQNYSHYMRLDDDTYFTHPLSQEVLDEALECDFVYTAQSEEDWKDLYEYSVPFFEARHISTLPYRNSVIYMNFHIASLALWRHPLVAEFADYLQDAHGCLGRGWTDSGVHRIIADWIAPLVGMRVRRDPRFCYRHNLACIHEDHPHSEYCKDGKNDQYPWGPPICLEKTWRT